MPLDPIYQKVREYREATGFTPLYTMSVEDARTADAETEAEVWDWHDQPKEIFDMEIPGPTGPLTLRVYRPQSEGPLPVLMYFFGGGWVVGSLSTPDSICRALSSLTPCIVVSVNYRLAPEHPFPAAPDDCYAATQWVAENAEEIGGDGTRLGVAGDSSGGNLAAVVSIMARDGGNPPIGAQVLVYPPTVVDADTESMRDNRDPMFFSGVSCGWFWKHYLSRPGDAQSPLVSPLTAPDHGGLPPTLMMTAEYCPLRDEGNAYAEALEQAGTPVELHYYEDLPHGFLALAAVLETSRTAMEKIAEFLRRRLA